MTDYQTFITRKSQLGGLSGFEPLWLPDSLFDFQRHLVEWAIREGRAALFEACGLGKTPQLLVWAENIVRSTNRPVLVLTPLGVSTQTVSEGEKFSVDVRRCQDGRIPSGARVIVTNYERLHHFEPSRFAGLVCDESSILKNFDGKRRSQITEFMRTLPYRLLTTATPSPNDFDELGTSSEALGHLGYRDMITRFFRQETKKDYLGWGRAKYRFRGHAERPFWRWVCSWARVCQKPSDLGFDDGDFILPPLEEVEVKVEDSTPRPGYLFPVPAQNLHEQQEELRVTIRQRCEKAAELMESHGGPSVGWCHLNDEADLLEQIMAGARQVSGSMHDDEKEEVLAAFASGQLQKLIVKPKIACFGHNWQHCCHTVVFPSFSWEMYHQLVRRFWRFGQRSKVTANVITTRGQDQVMASLRRKAAQAEQMFAALIAHVNEAVRVDGSIRFEAREDLPSWL